MASLSSPWVEWTGEYTKAAQAEALPPNEWAARVATAAAAAGERGDVQFSAGLAEMLARVLLSGESSGAAPAAAWKYAEAALAARLASPALLLTLLSSRYIQYRMVGEGNALVVPAWCLMEPAILRIATETMLVRI